MHHLVITAIGTDRPGICNRITNIISQASGNIIDSRIAIFGSEFTLIMLVSGEASAITRIETLLPVMGSAQDLMVVMKRTATHQTPSYIYKIDIKIEAEDKVGLIDAFTHFFSQRELSISKLSAKTLTKETDPQAHQKHFSISMTGLSKDAPVPDGLQADFNQLCQSLAVTGTIKISYHE
ncbi:MULTISPECIES: glycine cleavage system protein R [Vibrio]|uniref:Glycine cleavage system transcriptional repressor n=1 Tax=Vibrio algicola TaxID=2662262 RepID=A0A5Q0TJT9_9VIBR|nr:MULTISPECIES: ACT domain-containing protein [Vibrio]MBD1575902.1 glycine cleavage system transcriptional repressor [Vibrio sp. S11_S32]